MLRPVRNLQYLFLFKYQSVLEDEREDEDDILFCSFYSFSYSGVVQCCR
jgi:hypothetical protein